MDFSLAAFSFVLIKVILLLIALVLSAVYLYTKWTHSYWKKRGVPHEKPYPIVGNLQFLMRKSVSDYFLDLAKKFPEDFVGIYLGHKPTLVLQTPELAKNVLVRDADYFEDRYLYGGKSDPFGRYNLFTIKNPLWTLMRRECSPMFTSARLRTLTELMNGNAKELVSKINHDHIQQHNKVSLKEQMFREVDEAIKSTGKDILDYDDLTQLRYLTSCIDETLRKHPPVPYLERMCRKDYQVTDSLTIKAGTPVFVNVLAVHRNAKYYPEPEEWRPERFSKENESDNRQYTFLTFGEGPRFCIGKRYGMIQIQAALAQVIHRFRVEPETDSGTLLSDPYSLLLSPKGGGQLKFISRN